MSECSKLRRYSMTSSASNCRELGTSMPSALAVWRLMANSNFVDCKTGRSAGFAPPRALPYPRQRFSRVSGTRHKVSVFKESAGEEGANWLELAAIALAWRSGLAFSR